MNRAFIFDMDGVVVDSERTWLRYENDFLEKLLGKTIYEKIGDVIGARVEDIYEQAKKYGFLLPYNQFKKQYDETAINVYSHTTVSDGLEELAAFLLKNNFKLGLISASSMDWINHVLPKLSFKDNISSILSLSGQNVLKHKPAPDGYLAMMNNLQASPNQTAIIEDSNRGILAAKASGAFTIAYTEFLVSGYQQITADARASRMKEVIPIVKNHFGIA